MNLDELIEKITKLQSAIETIQLEAADVMQDVPNGAARAHGMSVPSLLDSADRSCENTKTELRRLIKQRQK